MLALFRQWLDANAIGLLPKAPLAQAFGYALRHWPALLRYTEHGILLPDNNALERLIRPIAIGGPTGSSRVRIVAPVRPPRCIRCLEPPV